MVPKSIPFLISQHNNTVQRRTFPNQLKNGYEKINGIETQWPSNCLDLNPIEYVWGLLKIVVEKRRPNNLVDLKEIIQEIWDNLPQTYIVD